MPQQAEFEEKEFETAANVELGRLGANVFSPGQFAERILGYDAAVELPPGAAGEVVRDLVGGTRGRGVRLAPNFWLGSRHIPDVADLPHRYVSLLIQYKRPEYVVEPRARQRAHWGQAYYRYRVRRPQHGILTTVEQNLGHHASVRYAAPAFSARFVLQTRQVQGQVLRSTNFVAPTSIGAHRSWTYIDPGTPGYANYPGEIVPSESFEQVIESAFSEAVEASLYDHLKQVGGAVQAAGGSRRRGKRGPQTFYTADAPRWAESFRIRTESLEALGALAYTGRWLGSVGTSWWIAAA
jgi:hypothetical protein